MVDYKIASVFKFEDPDLVLGALLKLYAAKLLFIILNLALGKTDNV